MDCERIKEQIIWNRIKQMYNDMDDAVKSQIERVFPELAESKDERIRKALIQNLKERFGTKGNMGEGLDMSDVLAWLEKQGEHANKIESKFHKGEWITNGDYTWKIVEVKPLDYILQSQDSNIVDDTISHVDEQFHSFTTQDTKDGDVLADSLGNVCIYQEFSTKLMYHSYCYGNHKCFIDMGGSHEIVGSYPATKEQRDLLFKKMHEAGYEWDAEKKELKKIEPKPAWSEEDEKIIIQIKDALEDYFPTPVADKIKTWLKSLRPQNTWKPSEVQMEILQYLCENSSHPNEKVIPTLESLYQDLKKLKE